MTVPPRNPAPAEVLAGRLAAGLSQAQAGALLYAGARQWQKWEHGEARMHPALWTLWRALVRPELRAALQAAGLWSAVDGAPSGALYERSEPPARRLRATRSR